MKQLIILLCLLTGFMFAPTASVHAQVIGKTYQIGDTIHIDGYHALVIQVDESGLHGLAMSHASSNFHKKAEKNYIKRLDKQLKKGQISEEDYQQMLEDFRAQKVVPKVPTENFKGGRRAFDIDEFAKEMGEGWRVPNPEDVQALNQFMIESTDNNTYRFNLRPQFQKDINLPYEWKETFFEIKLNGFIAQSDESASFAIKKLDKTLHFELYDKYLDSLVSIGVKNF